MINSNLFCQLTGCRLILEHLLSDLMEAAHQVFCSVPCSETFCGFTKRDKLQLLHSRNLANLMFQFSNLVTRTFHFSSKTISWPATAFAGNRCSTWPTLLPFARAGTSVKDCTVVTQLGNYYFLSRCVILGMFSVQKSRKFKCF